MKEKRSFENKVRESRFPPSLFFVYLVILIIMSGIHTGLIVGMSTLGWSGVIQTVFPILYWSAIAVGLTLFTRMKIRKAYEEPMHKLAEATKKVAEGDFSIYIAPLHTLEHLDYLDQMLMDFNKMVGELGSIETLKTDFFSNVSHEIKTPLSTSKRLADLISNILKLNKLEKQTITPVMQNYDVCEQLARCAISYEPALEKKHLEFDADMEDYAEISADPDLMELVWNNLFSNAVKFTESGGKITLTEKSDEDKIYVSVTDTGCGMTEETKKHIFEKFYQGDTSHATAGNGLGLALALRVLQLNNYKIEVTSKPGEGSTFTVIIHKAEKERLSEHE